MTLLGTKTAWLLPVSLLRLLLLATIREAGDHDYDTSSRLGHYYDFIVGKSIANFDIVAGDVQHSIVRKIAVVHLKIVKYCSSVSQQSCKYHSSLVNVINTGNSYFLREIFH